jgi:hypothetical protein
MTQRRPPDLWLAFWIVLGCCLALAVLLPMAKP